MDDIKQFFFNLSDTDTGMARNLAPGINTRLFIGEQAMLSVLKFEPNSVGSIHSHTEEQWGIILEGSGIRIQDDQEIPVKAGDFWLTPSNVSHGFKAGPNGAKLIDVFAPPREAYRQKGSGFATGESE